MKIQNGDHVVIISGKDKGKTGTVLRVLHSKNRVVVADVNMRTRHVKATPQRPGQKVVYEASIHASNVMVVDPKTKKRSRISFKVDAKGNKQRVATRSGEALTKKKTQAKAATESDDKKTGEKTKKAAPKKTDSVEHAATPPGKKPFWKRVVEFGGEEAAAAAEVKETSHMKEDHSVPDQVSRQSQRSHSRKG